MLIDELMPTWDVTERHQVIVRAPIEQTYHALRTSNLGASWIVRTLMFLRQLPALLRARRAGGRRRRRPGFSVLNLESAVRGGFTLLGERAPAEVALGLTGQFWKVSGGLRRHVDGAQFRAFSEPGYAKTIMGFALRELPDGSTALNTETRVLCTDASSRRLFRRYWLLIGPFSALIRLEMLRIVRRQAESASLVTPPA